MRKILYAFFIVCILSLVSFLCYGAVTDMKDTDTCTIESVGLSNSRTVKIGQQQLQRGIKCAFKDLKKIYLQKGEYIKARNNRTKQRIEILSKYDVPSTSNPKNNYIRTRGAYSKGAYELSTYFEEDPILYMVEDTIFIPVDLIIDDYNWINITTIPGNQEIISGYDRDSKEVIITKQNLLKKINISELDRYMFHFDYHSADSISSYFITNKAKIRYINPFH